MSPLFCLPLLSFYLSFGPSVLSVSLTRTHTNYHLFFLSLNASRLFLCFPLLILSSFTLSFVQFIFLFYISFILDFSSFFPHFFQFSHAQTFLSYFLSSVRILKKLLVGHYFHNFLSTGAAKLSFFYLLDPKGLGKCLNKSQECARDFRCLVDFIFETFDSFISTEEGISLCVSSRPNKKQIS